MSFLLGIVKHRFPRSSHAIDDRKWLGWSSSVDLRKQCYDYNGWQRHYQWWELCIFDCNSWRLSFENQREDVGSAISHLEALLAYLSLLHFVSRGSEALDRDDNVFWPLLVGITDYRKMAGRELWAMSWPFSRKSSTVSSNWLTLRPISIGIGEIATNVDSEIEAFAQRWRISWLG